MGNSFDKMGFQSQEEILREANKIKPVGKLSDNKAYSVRPSYHGTHFILCHERGVKIYGAGDCSVAFKMKHSAVKKSRHDPTFIQYAEMYGTSKLIALVCNGGGKEQKQKVVLLNTENMEVFTEIAFGPNERIHSVRFCSDRCVVVTDHRLHVSNVNTDDFIVDIVSDYNPHGVCDLKEDGLMAYPAGGVGSVQVVDLKKVDGRMTLSPICFVAHKNPIARLAISNNGRYVATASKQGTRILIFELETRKKVDELHRGMDGANITDIVFSPTDSWLAVGSDKGTVHIFDVAGLNSKSAGYRRWNTLQYKVGREGLDGPDEEIGGCSLMFTNDTTIITIAYNGLYAKHVINERDILVKYDFCYILDLGDDVFDYID